MSTQFKNEELNANDFGIALGLLMAKPLPPKIAWTVSDAVEFTRENGAKYNKLIKEITARYDVKEGAALDKLPQAAKDELNALDEIVVEMPVDPFELPLKDAVGKEIWYQPVIFSALKKLIVRK